ncbi:MAG: DNA-binding domain-containing protein [Dysgonamonadaceae bacterium]
MATLFWKIWLKLNLLTKDVDNDYTAEVSTVGNTKHNEDIAREIIREGSEIKYDTLLSILNQSDRVVRQFVQQGNSVQTGNVRISPRVSGMWIGANAKYDPTVHKITADTILTADLRTALTQVGVEMLGVKDSGAYIGLVIDTVTQLTDGTITAGDDICIEGDKLRVAPEGIPGIGIFFIDSAGVSTQVTRRFTQNDPKKIIARVPTLPAGEYTLQIATRYSNSSTLLNEVRLIEYAKKLIVT